MAVAAHQLVHTLSYGDAISGEVLALQRIFRSHGRGSEIYSINTHPKLKGLTRDYRELDPAFNGELILHYSLGSPLNERYAAAQSATRSLIYHNLTPAHWFAGVNPRLVSDIEAGLKALPNLCALSKRLIADSKFNAGELGALGFQSKVLELPIDPSRWEVESNPGIAKIVQDKGGVHVLHVGRLAPNKCIEDIIKSFYYLRRYINHNSHLWLVGIDIDTELYSFALKRMVHDFDMAQFVTFAGCLADTEVKALYENCTLYLCMSEHEGFCLPVVEAMHFGLPVISLASSALTDTIGKGGILVTEKRHPEIGELMAQVAQDSNLRERLIRAGRERVADLSFDNFAQHVAALF